MAENGQVTFAEEARPDEGALVALFSQTFADSEGAEEGKVIAALVGNLLRQTPAGDLRVFTARDAQGALDGAILFTPLVFTGCPRTVRLLSPVAVRTARQGQGVGQGLITHALETLRAEGVEVAVTYGDPAFYGRVGFAPVPVQVLAAPHPLSHPQGWLAQGLQGALPEGLSGPVRCAAAFDDPAYW